MKKITKGKKAVIFDLDGTVADTLSAITEAVNLTMNDFGYPERTDRDVRRAIGNGATNLVRRLMPSEAAKDETKVLQVRQNYDQKYSLTYLHTTCTYDGIQELVAELKDSNYSLAVFSNKQDEYVKKLCDQLFPKGTISIARGQTELPIKPNIAGLLIIMDQLGVTPDECIMVGDSEVDLKTAQNANMDFIGVAWGFVGREKLSDCGAEIIIDHPNEILEII